MTKSFDIFDIKSTSDEAKVQLKVGELEGSVVEFQAIVGRLYAKAARYKRKTNKFPAWKKAAEVRAKVNQAYEEQVLGKDTSSGVEGGDS
ncbi:MAG: hypothetical protein QNJ81_02110 [Acidimicrobiia bacterium]|nr:hypothetical protein [Acidimicrobiia bacterium]